MSDCLSGIFNYIDELKEKYAFQSYISRNKIIRNNIECNDEQIDKFYRATTNNFSFFKTNSRSRNSISIQNINAVDKDQFESNTQQLTTKDKYNLVWRYAQELANSFVSLNDSEFQDKLNIFLLVKTYFEKKVFI